MHPGNIPDLGYRDAVGAEERPVVAEIFIDPEAALVHQRVVLRAQQQEVVDIGLAAIGPVLDMMAFEESMVIASGERAAVIVPCPNSPLDRFRDDP